MKRRVARKILDPDGIHYAWYKSPGGCMWSLAPVSFERYARVSAVLKRKPYWDKEWHDRIKPYLKIE